MKNNNYQNYFKKHYNYALTSKDINNYKNWFYPQWKIISNKLAFGKDDSVLEIGSGTGGFFNFLLDKIESKNYVGIELDKQAVAFSNKFFKTDIFKSISLEEFTTQKKFNYIFAFEVLEHLDDPIGSLEKVNKLLKPGGIFIGTTPYPFEKNVIADETHLFVLHPTNWERHMRNTGFTEVSLYPMSFLPFLWRINKHLNLRIPFYMSFSGMISTCMFIAKK